MQIKHWEIPIAFLHRLTIDVFPIPVEMALDNTARQGNASPSPILTPFLPLPGAQLRASLQPALFFSSVLKFFYTLAVLNITFYFTYAFLTFPASNIASSKSMDLNIPSLPPTKQKQNKTKVLL